MGAEFDPRHNARILVLQKLFEQDFKSRAVYPDNDSFESIKPDFFSDDSLVELQNLEAYDHELVDSLWTGINEHLIQIDALVSKLAPDWPIKNIARIDLMIMRLAIAEGFILKATPQKVVINEAIELAKEFSNDQTRKFVSGVLGNLFENQATLLP